MIDPQIYGVIATGISIMMVGVGLPKQIYKNWKNKSCSGLDSVLFIFAFFAYTAWLFYGFARNDIFLIITNILGAFFVFIICVQLWVYRK